MHTKKPGFVATLAPAACLLSFPILLFLPSCLKLEVAPGDTSAKGSSGVLASIVEGSALAAIGEPAGYFTVGGTASGVDSSSGLQLRNNGGDDIFPTTSGAFVFPRPVANFGAYNVTLVAFDPCYMDSCTLTGGSGTVMGADVRSVQVSCIPRMFAC